MLIYDRIYIANKTGISPAESINESNLRVDSAMTTEAHLCEFYDVMRHGEEIHS